MKRQHVDDAFTITLGMAIGLVLIAILFLAGCGSTRGKASVPDEAYLAKWCPAGSPCARSITGQVPTGPGKAVEDAAWAEAVKSATERMRTEGGKANAKLIRPRIRYMSCNFIVANATVAPGGVGEKNVCAAGKTTANGKEIWVSVENAGRVHGLLVWEFRNSIYLRNGFGGWAY